MGALLLGQTVCRRYSHAACVAVSRYLPMLLPMQEDTDGSYITINILHCSDERFSTYLARRLFQVRLLDAVLEIELKWHWNWLKLWILCLLPSPLMHAMQLLLMPYRRNQQNLSKPQQSPATSTDKTKPNQAAQRNKNRQSISSWQGQARIKANPSKLRYPAQANLIISYFQTLFINSSNFQLFIIH